MKSSRADFHEHWLLLKSMGCMILITAAVLLLLRHASPAEEKDKFFGGGVSLLLARTPEDVKAFRRWRDLNDPGRIFGYNATGVFARSVVMERQMELPALRVFSAGSMETALYTPVAQKSMPLEMEKSVAAPAVIRENLSAAKSFPAPEGVTVFNERGEIVEVLKNIPAARKENALLLRAGKSAAGIDFRIIESSGDRRFDRSVASALENAVRKGKSFNGVLAVWPDPKRKEQK